MRHRLLLLFLLLASTAVSAQSRPRLIVRVRAIDSASAPVPDVTVSVVRGLKDVLASGQTDRVGIRVLQVDERNEFQVVARKVGYAPVAQVFAKEWRDTVSVTFTVSRLSQRLDTVRATAQQNLKKQRLAIDADAIANSSRPLLDATDIVMKLRPYMVFGLSLDPRFCPAAQFVWVNGQRVEYAPPNSMMEIKKAQYLPQAERFADTYFGRTPGIREPSRTLGATPAFRVPPVHNAYADLPIDVLSVLASIKPEHIASMEMHDCTDHSVNKRGGEAAIFVTLKDNVHFSPGIGSYAGSPGVFDSLLKSISLPARVASLPIPLETWRLRILGIFDASTGAAVMDADVLDAINRP